MAVATKLSIWWLYLEHKLGHQTGRVNVIGYSYNPAFFGFNQCETALLKPLARIGGHMSCNRCGVNAGHESTSLLLPLQIYTIVASMQEPLSTSFSDTIVAWLS